MKEWKSYHFLVRYLNFILNKCEGFSLSRIAGANIKISAATAVAAGAIPCYWHFLKLPLPDLIPVAPASASYWNFLKLLPVCVAFTLPQSALLLQAAPWVMVGGTFESSKCRFKSRCLGRCCHRCRLTALFRIAKGAAGAGLLCAVIEVSRYRYFWKFPVPIIGTFWNRQCQCPCLFSSRCHCQYVTSTLLNLLWCQFQADSKM